MIGMVLQSSNRPWRDNRNNYADLYMTFCLCALVVLSFNFANEPSDQGAIYKQSIEQAIIILVVIVTVVFAGLLVYSILLHRNRGVREVIYNLSILQLARISPNWALDSQTQMLTSLSTHLVIILTLMWKTSSICWQFWEAIPVSDATPNPISVSGPARD